MSKDPYISKRSRRYEDLEIPFSKLIYHFFWVQDTSIKYSQLNSGIHKGHPRFWRRSNALRLSKNYYLFLTLRASHQQVLTTIWGLSPFRSLAQARSQSWRQKFLFIFKFFFWVHDPFNKCSRLIKEWNNAIPGFDEGPTNWDCRRKFSHSHSYIISTGFMSAIAHDDTRT
jgi:hypothetical protein